MKKDLSLHNYKYHIHILQHLMRTIIKLVLYITAYSMFGFIGLIITIIIANILFSNTKDEQNTYRPYTRREPVYDINYEYKKLLAKLTAAIILADGKVLQSEKDKVISYFARLYPDKAKFDQIIYLFNEALSSGVNIDNIAVSETMLLPYRTRTLTLYMLFDIANADGNICEQEMRLLYRVAILLQISNVDYQSISAMFMTTSSEDSNWAYKILEITKDATNEEVKKAYRKMAMKYHPDKVASLGEEESKKATEQFKKVQSAYDEICKQRNIL